MVNLVRTTSVPYTVVKLKKLKKNLKNVPIPNSIFLNQEISAHPFYTNLYRRRIDLGSLSVSVLKDSGSRRFQLENWLKKSKDVL